MQTTYTYAVIAASGATVFVSGDKARARLMLASCRADYLESVFALVLETCYPSGRCDAHYIVSFYQPLEN